tara:strand:+ start:23 stop:499 length:477 start_codon:yes stop_codon:yes gene_type:complete
MSLNTFDYINKLLLVAAESLNIQYTKETPTTLNLFCSENEGAFIANLSLIETSRTPINSSLDNITYTIDLMVIVSRDYDLTNEDILQAESDARKIISKYTYLLKQNKFCNVQNQGFAKVYREGGFGGAGISGQITISLPDKDDNCDVFCNDMTIDVDC